MICSEIIERVCLTLDENPDQALDIIKNNCPFQPKEYKKRGFSPAETIATCIRDGFIDRYFGTKMVFPPVLRVISNVFPKEFPYHPNWKMSACHIAYWKLLPTLDHVIPIARGGENSIDNIVCTSMLHNSVKSNFTLEEIGWSLGPCGDFKIWDGMMYWYVMYIDNHPEMKKQPYFKQYFSLALKAIKKYEIEND